MEPRQLTTHDGQKLGYGIISALQYGEEVKHFRSGEFEEWSASLWRQWNDPLMGTLYAESEEEEAVTKLESE
tara:strand:- start:106 stop:321 length:216 start_codon:yes stop_codon:yes gene_type:complete